MPASVSGEGLALCLCVRLWARRRVANGGLEQAEDDEAAVVTEEMLVDALVRVQVEDLRQEMARTAGRWQAWAASTADAAEEAEAGSGDAT